MSSHAEEVGGWANDSERFVNDPCPDCDGEGAWDVMEPRRVSEVDGLPGRIQRQACPYCGGSGRRLRS